MTVSPINAFLAADGATILLADNQHIQETAKCLEIWQTEKSGLYRFVTRYRKTNRWVSTDKGHNFYML